MSNFITVETGTMPVEDALYRLEKMFWFPVSLSPLATAANECPAKLPTILTLLEQLSKELGGMFPDIILGSKTNKIIHIGYATEQANTPGQSQSKTCFDWYPDNYVIKGQILSSVVITSITKHNVSTIIRKSGTECHLHRPCSPGNEKWTWLLHPLDNSWEKRYIELIDLIREEGHHWERITASNT